MSSDGYFDGDDLDDAAYEELNAIEAAALETRATCPAAKSVISRDRPPLAKDDSLYDITFDIDERELQKLDKAVEDAYEGDLQPQAGPSRSKSATYQTTLFGDRLQSPSASSTRSSVQRTKSAPRDISLQKKPKEKVWDQTAFAKTGLKPARSKGKGKDLYDEGEEEDEQIEFEQFPAPFVPVGPPPPMKLAADLLEAKHWIYPLNKPKRDYQFNIVKNCLFKNTIVALPTGLGKTFIAGVVMLNYYRWFPDGKVIFVAPTKPLVAQQIEACHQICGIPGSDAAELTGAIARATRGRLWKEKRVFYMTPQTLVNDLTSENCDVRDIVLLVIDEAHRATGSYAYNQVVRFLMAKNPHFRVLALTATPGGNPDAVQNLIDGLHINHIEIRDENSLDIQPYTHKKRIEQHVISMSEDVNRVKALLSTLMDRDLKPLRQRGVIFSNPDPVKFHPYSAHSRFGQLTRDQRWAFAPLSRLGSLARAMGYLVEGTVGMCYTYLQELAKAGGDSGPGKTTGAPMKKALLGDPMFQAILKELDSQKTRGFSIHPKMDCLKTLVIQHFAQEQDNPPDKTRAMIFVTFREAVDEIVEALDSQRPLIRAHKFIGQGTDKQGKRGLQQKEQLDVIQRFKAGEFNVLVATSVGEEGLDIGEVDLIVCYDAQKTPIRMLQRLGRTGRKREGVVHVLLAEGREELNLDKAKDTYKEVQKTIIHGEQLQLYTDVPRLLPEHIKPECLEKPMEIQEYVRDENKSPRRARSPTAGKKRKRNDDPSRNIPTGASMGFVSVADLLVKNGTKRKVAPIKMKDFDQAGEDDDTDRDIETGLVGTLPQCTKIKKSKPSKKTDKGQKLKKKTILRKKGSKVEPPDLPSDRGEADAADADIERGLIGSSLSEPSKPSQTSAKDSHSSSFSTVHSITSSGLDDQRAKLPRENHKVLQDKYKDSMAWLVDEDEDPAIDIVGTPPAVDRTKTIIAEESLRPQPSPTRQLYKRSLSPSQAFGRQGLEAEQSLEFIGGLRALHASRPADNVVNISSSPDFSGSNRLQRSGSASPVHQNDLSSSPLWPASDSSSPSRGFKRLKRTESSWAMPSPDLPRQASPTCRKGRASPQPSFPVRQSARNTNERRSPRVLMSPDGSSPPQRRRLHRRKNLKQIPRESQPPIDVHTNPLFDVEALHSGDEVSEGSPDSEDEEHESDRLFVQELPETQVSPSYDQTLAYRQSLFTQAPAGAKAPAFENGPVRHGNFGPFRRPRPRQAVSSSPQGEQPDEYAIGSFVVDDEAEVSFLSDD